MIPRNQALPVIVAFDHALQAVLRLRPDRVVGIMSIHLAVAQLIGHHHVAAAVQAAGIHRTIIAVHLVAHQRAPGVRGIQSFFAGQRNAITRFISRRSIGNGGQLSALRQEAVIAQCIGVQYRPAQHEHHSRRRRQGPLPEDTAQALSKHDLADPEGQRRAQYHPHDQADFRCERQHEGHAQERAAHHRKHHTEHRLKLLKGQCPLGPLRFAHAVEQTAECQSQHCCSGARQYAVLRRAVEALVQRIRGRQSCQPIHQG